MRKLGKCPHCGGQLYGQLTDKRGRPMTDFIEANGLRLHKSDWAERLDTSYQLLNYHLGKGKSMSEIIQYFKDKKKVAPNKKHIWRRMINVKV